MFKTVVVYRDKSRWAGWPANCGIWSWKDEIVVGFISGCLEFNDDFHPISQNEPWYRWQARSLNGGETWCLEKPQPLTLPQPLLPGVRVNNLKNFSKRLPLQNPDFALACQCSGFERAQSWFNYSTNRCRTWQGPYRLPFFGQSGIAARTSYQIIDEQTCLFF